MRSVPLILYRSSWQILGFQLHNLCLFLFLENIIHLTGTRLSWASTMPEGGFNRITVRIDDGTVPAGLRLKVETTVGTITYLVSGLDGTAQEFITNIGNQTRTDQVLVYTLEVVDFGSLFTVEQPLTIAYTLETVP
jgi:hypothetical protein